MPINISPPSVDEIEVNLFGPGYGESILIHLGDHKFIVIDSCINKETKNSAVLDYFSKIGLDPNDCILMIVISHWHTDHTGGLAKLVEKCQDAELVIAFSFQEKEFITFITREAKRKSLQAGTIVRELRKILEIRSEFTIAQINKRLRLIPKEDMSHGNQIEIWALSPTDKQYLMFLDSIRSIYPTAGDNSRKPARVENHTAVVLQISIGTINVLLGSDLEVYPDKSIGWHAIIDNTSNPLPPSEIYKVAHHGSIGSYHPDIWNNLLVNDPVAILTPWNKGGDYLPKNEGVDAIKLHTSNAFITCNSSKVSKKLTSIKREKSIQRTIEEGNYKLKVYEPTFGQIQLRKHINNNSSAWQRNLSVNAGAL